MKFIKRLWGTTGIRYAECELGHNAHGRYICDGPWLSED